MFLFLLCFLLSLFVYYKLIKPCSYWKEKKVKHVPGYPLVGSMGKVILRQQHFADVTLDLYNKFPKERYVGYLQFSTPYLMIRDIDLIRQLVVKAFDHFHDHAIFGDFETDLLLSKSLGSLRGEKWRDMRTTLSPAFTGSKMRNMYTLIAECADTFINHFQEEVDIEAKNIFSKYATDVIATTAFGIKVDSLNDPDNEFHAKGVALTEFTPWQIAKLVVSQASKSLNKMLSIQIYPENVTKFFKSIITENIRQREAQGIVRPDLIHLLMQARQGQLKNEVDKETKAEGFATAEETQARFVAKQVELTDDHIVAQALLFFLAGFDTVSTAASFMAHELAVNPDIQKKLQEEIDGVRRKCKSQLTYEALLSMKYMDQVLCETLRLWPPGFQADRLCVKDYLIQPTTPEEKGLVVEKGSVIIIPIIALHRDPRYYPEPNRFDPERFSDKNKAKVVPGSYLPFGLGPRNCIGSRFAILEIKTLFYYLLSKHDIVPIQKTMIPIKVGTNKVNLQPDNGYWLGFRPRTATIS